MKNNNIQVEAEGGELIIRNGNSDYVIIPKKYRTEVQDMIKDGCHGCIDKLVETLPVMEDYAQDGSLYSEYLTPDSPTKKHPLDPNPDGSLPSYFKGSKENPIELDEVTVTAEAPEWVKYRKEYVKNNPFNIDEYVENRFNNPVGREVIEKIDSEGWRKKLRQEGLEKRYNDAMDYVGEQLVKNKPQGDLSRAEWLNQMSDKEEELIKRNPKYQSSLWADTKRGLTSLVEQNPLQTFKNILNSSDYTNREKQEMLKDYADHPVMSKLGDAAKILNPLTVPSKMVQSAYKDDYSFTDALKGKKNNAGIVEDIVTDPLNLVGLGIWGKLSKANKFKNLDEAYNAIKTLDKVSLEKQLGNTISNEDWQYLYRVQEKGFDIEKPTLKAIEDRVSAGEGKWYDHNILNNPELRSNIQSRDKYYGQWFDSDPKRLDYYLADKGEEVDILRTKVPKKILDQYRIDKIDPEIAKKWSLSHETEYIVPKDLIQQAEKFDKKDWQKLIDEHEKIKQIRKHKIDKVIDATKAGSKVLSKTDDVVKNASLIPNWTVPKIKSVEEIDKLDNLHPVFKTFDKDTWKEIAQKKGNKYFLDRFNKQLVNVTNDLNSYENLAINISDYPEIIEGKKWSEDFVKSSEWKQRVKNANPDLTEEQINNLQKSTLLSMPSNMKTFIKNQASKNSFHGGQFTYDDLVHSRNVAFRYFTPEEVLDHPLHFKSLASHEFGHSQSSMRKLPNDKTWHQPLEESGDMMKTNDIYKGDRYVELSEEKRARSIPSYMFAKENNLLENGEFTEKTYDILKNMAEKDWKSVPNDFNSILSWYDKKSAINYLNKFYATIPFYLYLQSQNQNQNKNEQ